MARQMPTGERNRNERWLVLIDTRFVALDVGIAEELRRGRAFLRLWEKSSACSEATVPARSLFDSTKDLMLRSGRNPRGAASHWPRWVIPGRMWREWCKKRRSWWRSSKASAELSFCHIHGAPAAPPLPCPKGDFTSDLAVSLVTETLIPHYGMLAVPPRSLFFFFFHITAL